MDSGWCAKRNDNTYKDVTLFLTKIKSVWMWLNLSIEPRSTCRCIRTNLNREWRCVETHRQSIRYVRIPCQATGWLQSPATFGVSWLGYSKNPRIFRASISRWYIHFLGYYSRTRRAPADIFSILRKHRLYISWSNWINIIDMDCLGHRIDDQGLHATRQMARYANGHLRSYPRCCVLSTCEIFSTFHARHVRIHIASWIHL